MNDISTFIDGKEIAFLPLNSENVKLYAIWRNRPNVRIYGRLEIPVTVEKIKKEFEPSTRQIPDSVGFEIWHKKDQKAIGDAGIFDINWFNRSAKMGLMIGEPDYWGHHVGTEATRILVTYAFNELNLNKLYGEIFSPNTGSIRCAEKNGFIQEGILKKDVYINGKYEDTFVYSLLKEDWLKLRK
ncbi:MAG: GNAT family N-acetyltransferase [Promethearchaeota archaeon]